MANRLLERNGIPPEAVITSAPESSRKASARSSRLPKGQSCRTAVCIIVENNSVPFDRRVWQEARALAAAGYEVSVICPKGSAALGEAKCRDTIEGIEIYRHRKWEAANALGYISEYSWALICEFLLALRVYRRRRFRVLQVCNPPDAMFLIGVFFKLLGVRFIFDHHDLSPELFEAKFRQRGLPYRLVCAAEKLTFRTADVCIATNESFREVALARGGARDERVFVVRNCPDLVKVSCLPPQPVLKNGRPLRVLYVGLMAEQDGVDLLITAIEHILRDHSRQDTEFVLVGDGPALPGLRECVARNGLDSFVTFAGRVPYERVGAYLSSADVGVAPDPKNALNDQSTMIKIFEYMAYGLPVVLFDLKEGRRVAGPAALYARPNDARDLAKRMTTLLDSSQLRRRLGECGRRRIQEKFNWGVEKQTLLEAYRTALSGSAPLSRPAHAPLPLAKGACARQ
jgi:glycosyltransferase involved in cell wall biosynthesis